MGGLADRDTANHQRMARASLMARPRLLDEAVTSRFLADQTLMSFRCSLTFCNYFGADFEI